MPSSSRENLYVGVRNAADPTGATVSFAFTASDDIEPDSGDYTAGAWVSGQSSVEVDGVYVLGWTAYILVSGSGGGGTVTLAEGEYVVWVKFHDLTQSVVRNAGKLKVT